MALSALLTLVLPWPSKVRIISTIRARKLLSHSSTPWTVKPRWAGTSWCCFSTRTVLPFITDVTLWSIKQISSAGVCSREARKFGCWACPCENKVKCSYALCYTSWLLSAIIVTTYKIRGWYLNVNLLRQTAVYHWLSKYLSSVKYRSKGCEKCATFLKRRTF